MGRLGWMTLYWALGRYGEEDVNEEGWGGRGGVGETRDGPEAVEA